MCLSSTIRCCSAKEKKQEMATPMQTPSPNTISVSLSFQIVHVRILVPFRQPHIPRPPSPHPHKQPTHKTTPPDSAHPSHSESIHSPLPARSSFDSASSSQPSARGPPLPVRYPPSFLPLHPRLQYPLAPPSAHLAFSSVVKGRGTTSTKDRTAKHPRSS